MEKTNFDINEIENLLPEFVEANSLANEVGEINDTYKILTNELENNAFIPFVEAELSTQQSETFEDLVFYGQELPYEDMGHYMVEIDRRINETKSQIAECDQEELLVNESIDSDIKKIQDKIKLSKVSSLALVGIAENIRKEQLIDIESKKTDLIEEFNRLNDEMNRLIEVFENVGQAWPLPDLIDIKKFFAQVDENAEHKVVIGEFTQVPQIPLNPAEHPTAEESQEARHYYEINRGVSKAIAELLIIIAESEDKRPITSREIAPIVYSGKDITEDLMVKRTRTAINHNKRYGLIESNLNEHGYTLEKAPAYRIDANGNQVSRGYFVYQAVPIVVSNQEILSEIENLPTQHNEVKDIIVEEEENFDTPEIVTPEVFEDNIEANPNTNKNGQEILDQIANSVEDLLPIFAAEGILDKDTITWAIFCKLGKRISKRVGTDEMKNRGYKIGILTKDQLRNNQNFDLPLEDSIILMIQNSFQTVFAKKNKRLMNQIKSMIAAKIVEYKATNPVQIR